MDALPNYKRSLKGDSYRQFRAVVDRLADTLGTTWQQGLRDLKSGGLVLAVEGEKGRKMHVILVVIPKDPDLLARFNDALLESWPGDSAAPVVGEGFAPLGLFKMGKA